MGVSFYSVDIGGVFSHPYDYLHTRVTNHTATRLLKRVSCKLHSCSNTSTSAASPPFSPGASIPVPSIPVTPAAVDAADVGVEVDDDDDDALLQAALAMSMAEAAGEEAGDAPAGAVAETPAAAGGAGGSSFVTPSAGEAFLDPAFVNSLLAGLPGVDMNDPKIQEAMQQVTTGGADGKEDEGEKDKDAKDKKDGGN